MSVFMNLYHMYEEELYTNCHVLAQFYLSNPQLFQITQDVLFCVYIINANSLWEMKHYMESQRQYEAAMFVSIESQTNNYSVQDREIILGIFDNFTEVELKFRIAKCLIENHLYKEANSVLQSIPLKQRPAKVHDLICKVQQSDAGTDKSLIVAYKEILKKCPLAFECIDGLLALGVKGSEVNSLIINVCSKSPSFDWLNYYVRGLSEIYSRKYSEAIMSLASIDSMKSNSRILTLIGESFFFSGDYETAYNYYKKAYELYPFMKVGIQKYAMLCEMFKKTNELEHIIRTTSTNSNVYEYTNENWFVLATYLYSCGKFEKAQYFINRVILVHTHKNVDALILNAKILHCTKKSTEALISLRQALKYEPFRFEAHRWIIEILIATDRGRDAQNQASKSLKILGDYPRTLTLAASSYLKAPVNREKARTYLQKALELNEHYVKAIFFYGQMLIEDGDFKTATKLLEKSVAVVPNLKIVLMLADLYAKTKNLSSALEYYTKALNIDPSNRYALNGLMALGSVSSTNESGDLDTTLEDIEDETSKNKNTDESEELVWSDDQDIEIS
ncbi:hypothetical protein PVAND_012746 [Polypedilum vanderplanki]|uniref:Anaphase-promoting complex subunit 7 n=1 Tax=Polypedilum vanderplanki TaxID=319348 RepID=A0A9J6CNH4_POLVA|nr:hypothetical protein PVAND_012746 [Polypedilum vanderplanki]